MYLDEELSQARRAIAVIAKRNDVPEDVVRAEIQAAIRMSLNTNDPNEKSRWPGCEMAGVEPTPEEVITWIATIVKQELAKQ